MFNIITQRKIYKILYKKRQTIFYKQKKRWKRVGWGDFFFQFLHSLSLSLPLYTRTSISWHYKFDGRVAHTCRRHYHQYRK